MKISSGTKISKSTLSRSVRAATEQDVLRNLSKDSSEKGVYVSLSYAPGSGKPQLSGNGTEQFILVTIHNIPRFKGGNEAISVSPRSNLYYRIEPDGKTYSHSIGNGEFSSYAVPSEFVNSHPTLRLGPGFVNYPYSNRGPDFKRPWVTVDSSGRYTSDRSHYSPLKSQGLFHPKMVSDAPNAVLDGTGVYIQNGLGYNHGDDWYKWVQSDDYVNVTYPIVINQSLLPDLGEIGLTDIQVDVEYKKFYEGQIQNPNDYLVFANRNPFNNTGWDQPNTGLSGTKLFGECVHFESGGGSDRIGEQRFQSRDQLNREDPWASINELPLYGHAASALRPAHRKYYPGIKDGGAAVDVQDSNGEFFTAPDISKPKLILSDDGKKVVKTTIGSWWSKDPKYGRSIGYRHELQVQDKNAPGSWRTVFSQNDNFTKSNIKSEDLQPVTYSRGHFVEVDQDYLNYSFPQPFEIRIAEYLAVRGKITARLSYEGQTYEGYMYSEEVTIQPQPSASSYYYYYGGGDGIGVSNLQNA